MPLKIEFDKEDLRDLEEYTEEFEDRLRAFSRLLLKELSDKFIEGLRSRIPDEGWYATYRNILDVAEIQNTPDDAEGFAVIAKTEDIDNVDIKNNESVLMFPSVSGNSDQAQLSNVMSAHSPWAVDMVPPIESGYEIPVTVRQVSEGEVTEVRQNNASVRQSVINRIESSGFSVNANAELEIKGDVFLDLPFMVLREEFGSGRFGVAIGAHWRPMILKLRDNILDKILKSEEVKSAFEDFLADPDNASWERELRPLQKEIGKQFVEQTEEFMNTLFGE